MVSQMSPGYNFVFKVPIKSKSISRCFYHACTALYLITVSGPTMAKINHFGGILMGLQSVVKFYPSCTCGPVVIFLISFSLHFRVLSIQGHPQSGVLLEARSHMLPFKNTTLFTNSGGTRSYFMVKMSSEVLQLLHCLHSGYVALLVAKVAASSG